jgi:uncharacterized membrane protein
MIEPIVIVAVVIACTALYMQYLWRRRRRLERAREEAIGTAELNIAPQQDSGLELLARRYARGEIDRAEYLQKKGDIVGTEIPVDGGGGGDPNSAELLNRGPVHAEKPA